MYRPVTDVFAVQMPEDFPEQGSPEMMIALENIARDYVVHSYDEKPKPDSLTKITSEWEFVNDPERIEIFQPPEHCAACVAGNDQARAFLAQHPEKTVIMARVHYTEVWP